MFDRGRDDMRTTVERRSAPQIAAFTASVPDDVNSTSRGRAPKNVGDLFARSFERDACRAALAVQATGIAELSLEEREHRVARGGPQR